MFNGYDVYSIAVSIEHFSSEDSPPTVRGYARNRVANVKNRGGIAPAAVSEHLVPDYFFGYLIVISLSRLSAPSTSFITHSM